MTREELHETLCSILGSSNVYYQPPESVKMEFPAIVYAKSNINVDFADDVHYFHRTRYQMTVIDKVPDNPVIMELLELPYTTFDRHYKADNLNHDVLTIYC